MEEEENIELKKTKNRKIRNVDPDNGFGDWGGYMAAKRAKLLDQFKYCETPKLSNIFEGVAIHVNGLTSPPIDELRKLMAAHGGLFHMYQVSSTTHIIASNLPNVKIKHLGSTPIVKPSWITESINYGKLLDYRRYLLYTNQSNAQPRIEFPIIVKTEERLFTSLEDKNDQKITPESCPDILKLQKCLTNSTQQNKTNVLTEQSGLNTPLLQESCITSTVQTTSKSSTKTASDPKFLEEFYNNSRLHLISTLGAEFKHLVGQLREKSNGIFTGKQKLMQLRRNMNSTFISNTVIMHIDMDCFFVSVSLRKHPELRGKPVAIAHAHNGQLTNIRPEQKANREQEFLLYSDGLPEGTSKVNKIDVMSSMSELASCSYEARQCGIRNGMFLGQAIKLCPELVTLSYDFEGIKCVSHTLYDIMASYTLDIEAVSCDEMYVDVTNILKETGISVEEWATYIRNEIMSTTGCPCSAGFGANRLQARLATKRAKPAGQYFLKQDNLESYMAEIKLSELPGVGAVTVHKLRKMGLQTCGDVQMMSLKILQNEIGQKAGITIKEQSMGVDNKPLNFHHERKSVSAEVNYGIRFKTIEECYNFLKELSIEVFNRMNNINMRARCLTLKLLVRSPEAPLDTAKFLGHGVCDSFSKSTTSGAVFSNPEMIFKESKTLYEKLNPQFSDLRGMGLQLSKLEKNAPVNNALSKFLKPSRNNEENSKYLKPEDILLEQRKTVIKSGKPKKCDSIVENIETSKKRKGRPKETKVNNSRDLDGVNNYFAKAKRSQNIYKSVKTFQEVKQINMAILNELPQDLRDEIMIEYNLNEYTNDPKPSQINQKEKKDKEVFQDILSPGRHLNNDTTQKLAFGGYTWFQIKHLIKKWSELNTGPHELDIDMIADYFKQLALDQKIEDLHKMFNFLHRTLSVLNCNWHKAYLKIVNVTQEGMVARYGKTLLLQSQFNCCKM